MSTLTITDLLEARIAEDEAAANACNQGPWFYNGYSAVMSQPMMQTHSDWEDAAFADEHSLEKRRDCVKCDKPTCDLYTEDYHRDSLIAGVAAHHGDTAIGKRPSDAEHIARHDPSRVLAECAAKRAIIASLPPTPPDPYSPSWHYKAAPIVAALAAVYKDHPDYRTGWAL